MEIERVMPEDGKHFEMLEPLPAHRAALVREETLGSSFRIERMHFDGMFDRVMSRYEPLVTNPAHGHGVLPTS